MAVDSRTFVPTVPGPPLLPERPVPTRRQQLLVLDGIQPPAGRWVDANDILQLQVRNSLAGVQLQVSARLMEPDGRIITPAFTLSPTSDRAINSATQALYEGYLLSASVQAIGATLPRRGQTYGILKLNRMPAPSNLIHYILGADYVSSLVALEWPYGRVVAPTEGPGVLNSIAVAAPLAGNDWSQTVPTNGRWRIRSAIAALATSAAVAARQVFLQATDGVNQLFGIPAQQTQAAGTTVTYQFVPGVPYTTVISGNLPVFLPPDMQLFQAFIIRALTVNLQAGDVWSAIRLEIEEWLED